MGAAMKPLPPAPLTHEDNDIWVRNVNRWFVGNDPGQAAVDAFHGDTLGADRRDAELMLQLTHYDHWERDYTRDRVRSVATAFRLVWRQI